MRLQRVHSHLLILTQMLRHELVDWEVWLLFCHIGQRAMVLVVDVLRQLLRLHTSLSNGLLARHGRHDRILPAHISSIEPFVVLCDLLLVKQIRCLVAHSLPHHVLVVRPRPRPNRRSIR